MLRFILENKQHCGHSGATMARMITTTDIDVLEDCLRSGGQSETSYDSTHLIGVEIVTDEHGLKTTRPMTSTEEILDEFDEPF